MAKRKTLDDVEEGGSYFSQRSTEVDFIPSGCTLFDCVLGGGYPLGRITNIVGDKSTGKTLLAIEACANFKNKFSGQIFYRETESAFDPAYAEALGMPVDDIDFGDSLYTVEDWHDDLIDVLDKMEKDEPGLYILDSLDALSDEAELAREIDKGSYGAAKAKKLSELFRKLVQPIAEHNVNVLVVSQIRDAIGVMFGKKHTRSGGKALDFYASQVIWLAHIKRLQRTHKKVKRAYGVEIKAKCEKNKIALPFRECNFNIIFGYGIDSIGANFAWLESIGRLKDVGLTKDQAKELMHSIDSGGEVDQDHLAEIEYKVVDIWGEIEQGFLPTRKKY